MHSDKPLILPHHAIMALVTAADRARRAMSQTLQPFDVTLAQFNVLTILAKNKELPIFQIAARMVEATPGITRLVSTLESKGLLRRVQAKGDRRQQLCSLTPRGQRLLQDVLPSVAVAQRALLDDLTASEAQVLTRLLRRVPAGDSGHLSNALDN